MSKTQNKIILLTVILVVWWFPYVVYCDFDSQPRIIAHDGDLVFQSAQDKNITIRLGGNSRFMINDVNVLESLQKVSIQTSPSDATEIARLPTQVQVLQTDVRRLINRLQRVENRTASLPSDRIRTLQTRVRVLMRRVTDIEIKLREDNCSSNPCKNGGVCFDLYDNFHCECPDAWTGKTCEEDVDECNTLTGTDLGCQNNAACVNLLGSYRCACTNGFTGIHCRERGTDCSKSRPGELCGSGACIPANNVLGYECICNSGWKADPNTKSCTIDVNECLESLVPCHTSCINLPGSFMCGPCPSGYTGNGVTCRDIDECAAHNGGCSTLPKVQCINTEGSHRCGNCPPGWTGDGRYCSQAETNACADNTICHPLARCEYISNTMVCVCPHGMTGHGYGPAGCSAGSVDPCSDHQCQNGGTCISRGSTYSCICPVGFDAPFCQNVNPCADNPCLNGGTCSKQDNSNDFRCVCPRGTTGRFCQNKRNTCGSVIRDRNGDLTYPPDGGEYKQNEACAWVIRTDENLILNVTFARFNVQLDPECSKDWLQINDGRTLATPLIGRFCGNQLPNDGNILSSQNTLFLWFRTDNNTNSEGFSLNWNSVAPICGGHLPQDTNGHGVIKSPGYPGKSPPKRDCEWIIEAPLGRRILLRFYEVVMDRSANCTKDSLAIYDTNELLENVCESGVPPPKYTSSNVAKLHFHTDPYREDSLFQVHYEVVEGKPGCGGLFTEPVGKLIFDWDMTNCVFLIQQPPGIRISIAFEMSKTPEIFTYSFVDIKVYDGKTDEDPVLAESNDNILNHLPSNLSSSGNFMLIVVTAKNFFMHTRYAVLYEANYNMLCGEELKEPQGGTFSTPHYPQPYYTSLNCVYSIIGPLDSIVHLNISDYNISEYDEGCTDDADFIEIYYTISGSAERHCKDAAMHIVAPSNYLRIVFRSNTNPQKRRGFKADYNFEQLGCGGVLRNPNGLFQLLNPVSANNAYCEWILEAPEGQEISIDLLYRRTGTKCSTGEPDLRIFLNGTASGDRLVESYCGAEKRVSTVLPTNLATIFLKLVSPSLGSAVSYSIQGNYTFTHRTSNCGGNFTLQSGFIQSPNWPNEYYGSLDCIWVIHAPLGHKIELVPSNFSLEWGFRCEHDYLDIRNGMSDESPLIGEFCGTDIPSHIPSFTNHLYLHFHSDSSLGFPGFYIPFQQTATGCGGSLSSHSGSIASPHYPEISHGPVQCDWQITVSQGSAINVSISKLGPFTDDCYKGVLTLYDGDDSMAKIIPLNCSMDDSTIVLSSSGNMLLVRYTLPEVGAAENEQFYLSYTTNCQQLISDFEGVIESPNFPEDYPNHLDCEWNIVGHNTDTISLTFSHFELETHDTECTFDVFTVIDMKNDETLQTKTICRNPAEVITSDGNKVIIKFKTDFSNVGKGFRLEYKRNGCGGYLTRPWGTIASLKAPYSVDVYCEWLIEAAPGKQVILDISVVHIESMSDDCSANALIVKDDKNSETDLLKECRVQQMPMTVTSQRNTMFIKFFTNAIRSRKYLKASYRTKDAQCGGIFRGNKGEITSPRYPQNYSANTYCDWMISVEGSSIIKFEFKSLDLPLADENCTNAYVEVYNGIKSDKKTKLIGRYCNWTNVLGSEILPMTSRINVIFNSGDGPPGKGFALKFEKICGGTLTEESGFIKAYPQDTSCLWIIEQRKEGSKIVLNFMHIDCHCEGLNETECLKTRGVIVSPGRLDASIPRPLTFCENHPPDIMWDSQYLVVHAGNVSFIATYSTIETSCGGLLTSLRGSFTSPYYPETYPSNIECIWLIQAQPGNYLELNFDEIDITKSDGCNQDYLEVREKTSNGKLLGVYCSNTKPDDGLQVFEQFWIKFRSSENGVGKGFKLSWRHAQVNAITGFNGHIQPPPIVSMRSEKEPFQWRISVPRDNLISLTFAEYNRGLKLYDGFDSDALSIEIQMSPWEITSSTNVIFLISDNQILENFRIAWKAISKDAITKSDVVQACNETLNIAYGPVVNLISPGYPTGYEQNLNCQWLVKPDHPTRHAVVRLLDVRLEKLDNCYADYLQIFSSKKNFIDWHEELKICDLPTHTPVVEIHGTPNLKLTFITDASVNKTGFEAELYTVCGGNLTGSIGRILDVDVLDTGKGVLIKNCTWHIEVGAGKKIEFTFQFPLNTAKNSSSECSNYALVRDGIDDGAPILPPGRICSYKEFNGTVFTTSSYATVRYFMQQYNPFLPFEGKMWNLTYREYSECGGDVRLTPYSSSVSITSPNYPNVPNAHTECLWTIIAPPGQTVQAEFVGQFDMNVRYCDREYVELRDGSTALARQLGKYCVRPGTIHTSGNVLYMRYLTDIAEPRNGFNVNVSLSTCGGTFTQLSYIITSSKYPAPGGYSSNSICDYVIKVSMFARLNLSFIDLNLPFNEDNLNASDHVTVYQIVRGDGTRIEDELTTVYGNTTSMPTLQIESNEILIRLFSYKANNLYRGFKVKYQRIFGACNKDVSGENGFLTFNVTPMRIAMFVSCRWKITVPKGKRVKIQVVDGLNTVTNPEAYIKVMFYNDFQSMSRITALNLKNMTDTTVVSSTDNKMFVRIFGSYATTIIRIRFAYTSLETSNCPDEITSDTGSLSIASLDPTKQFYCSSDFVLNGMQTLAFHISRFVAEITDLQHSPGFGVRFRVRPFLENLAILMVNVTNGFIAMAGKHGSVQILQNDAFLVKQFEATFMKHPCGGEYHIGNKFEISLPNLTAGYGNLDCAWHLSGTANRHGYEISTIVSKFTLPCENEYFAVHAGASVDKLEVVRLCISDTLNVTRIRSDYVYLYYHTTEYSPSSELRIAVERAGTCGEKLQIEKNEMLQFTSADYKNNLECVWEFQTNLGFYLRLEFSGRFYIEESKDCVKDYLEVRTFEQGTFVPLQRYCGRNMPSAVNTTLNRLQLVFRSDNTNTGDGFTVEVQQTCYGVFNVTKRPQLIVSPTRWGAITMRIRCDYILQTDSNKLIQVKFRKFSFGYRNRCTVTSFSAQKRTENGELIELGPYCKDNTVSELRAKKFISLTYRTLIAMGSYEIEFYLDECGGQVTQSMWIGSLRNENGDGYVDNMNCVWNITAPEGHNIAIQFKYLVMEEMDGCSLDYVAVYRGPYANANQREAKLCGNMTTNAPKIHIDGNSAVIVAVSDSSITKDGFSAKIIISEACDERLTLTQANSPVEIVRAVTVGSNETVICNYRIMGEPGYRIEIEFTKIEINSLNGSCNAECRNCEYLEVLDSLQGGGLTLGKYCMLRENKPKLMSSYKDAVILTNFERQGNHQFVAKVRLAESDCGGQSDYVLEGESGVQISPSTKPNGLYSSNIHCTWTITSKRDFEIKFQRLNLQNVSDTTGRCIDYVLVTYTANYKKTNYVEHCGSISLFVINVDKYGAEASADITFHTDEEIEATGFTLTATNRASCNRIYNDTNGMIKGMVDINEACIYDIYMPDNYTVNIIIPTVYLRESNCSTNYIRVYDKNTNRQIYERCTEDYTPRKIFTLTNRVRLDFKVKQMSDMEIFYYGSYKPLVKGCGGDLSTLRGYVDSPDYTGYGHASVCRWNLTTTPSNRFEIIFLEFSMGSVCRADYLNIIEISANGDEKIGRHYCENNMPQTYTSESNQLAIVSVAAADFDGTGWRLEFRSYTPYRN